MVATDLVSLAIGASKHAYVPYSHFPIGAALKTKMAQSILVVTLKMLVLD